MKKLLTYTTYLAAVAVISLGHVHAACGGGGYQAPVKAAPAEKQASAEFVILTAYGASLDSTRFDSVSSRLDLSKGQVKEILEAKISINGQNKKLAKAQDNAQAKLDGCDGDCEDAKRVLARSTEAVNSYNTNGEFDLRLRSILRPNQAMTYFKS